MSARDDMPPQYDAKAAESRWYGEWVERGYFHPEPSDRQPYCIVLPPPNVTGALHVGGALNHTLQDILARRARMQGFETLWLPGMDHASIAVHVLLERQLATEGLSRHEMGREAFLERAWAWKEEYGGRILGQMEALGDSVDWDRLRFTMDEGLSRAVRVAFVRLYEDGLIYRGERIINWCPTDQTALSDSEVEHEEVEGELVTFRYPLSEGSGHVDVSTTRVETMLGDTGVAVHPADGRFRHLVGKTVRHPFTGRDLPIVADTAVDPEFGTGAVKVTPAHDPTDFEIAERTGLPAINILNVDATLADTVPEEFRGLDRYEARARVLDALRERGLIVGEERPYRHAVGTCYRCHSELEPWLSGKQWFVAVDSLKEPAAQAARDGRVRFFPERWRTAYLEWLDNLRDWNISRQLWWGHRIPVWYCPNGHEVASIEDPTACPECRNEEIEQDPDVLDTWFSSQLWPFSTLGWPDETKDLKFFYPTTVLVTGYEILYLWVARMIMSGLYLVGEVPFRDVVIHGLVRDRIGRKMGKSLGNVIDPLDMIDQYGADALRFALTRMASPDQQNLPLSEETIELGRNFANKIWNAARLVLSSDDAAPELPGADRSLVERWVLSRHEACRREVDQALGAYRFDDAAQSLQRFLWHEFADWGLELAKESLRDPGSHAASVHAWILERTLRLLHPIMPFVTEEVWQRLGRGGSIVVAQWPDPRPDLEDEDAEAEFGAVQLLVNDARQMIGLLGTSRNYVLLLDPEYAGITQPIESQLERLLRATIEYESSIGERTRFIPLHAGRLPAALLVPDDVDAKRALEQRRKKLSEATIRLEATKKKLENQGFLAGAGQEAVEKAHVDVNKFEAEAKVLQEQIDRLQHFQ